MWNTLSPLADTPMRVCFDRSTLIHGLLKLSLESTLQLGKEPVRHQIVCVCGGAVRGSGRTVQNVRPEGAGVVPGTTAQLQNTPKSKDSKALWTARAALEARASSAYSGLR